MHSTGTGQPVETQDVFFWRLAGRSAPTGLAIVHWIGCINAIKTQNQLLYDPSLTHKGGPGVKLTGYLDSPHMLSQYLLIYSEAIKATIKEI